MKEREKVHKVKDRVAIQWLVFPKKDDLYRENGRDDDSSDSYKTVAEVENVECDLPAESKDRSSGSDEKAGHCSFF